VLKFETARATAHRWSFGVASGVSVALMVASAAPAVGAGGQINIDLTYESVMDLVRPISRAGISVHHNLNVTLNGNKLSEARDRSTGRYFDKNATVQERGSTDPYQVVWRVVDQQHLVRTQAFPQSVRTMTVTLNPDNTCRLDVVDQLKPGFQEYAFLRISVHELGYFSSYRVVGTTCAIR
jgi:hypothetical protein